VIFASVICDRCGKEVNVENIAFCKNRLLCSNCAKLGCGITCGDCIYYNIVDNICCVSNDVMKEDSECYCALVREHLYVPY